jgi:ribosomal protein S18 acetylase RimI-like enzyme
MIWRRRKGRAVIRRLLPEDAAIWRDLRLEALLLHPEAYGSSHDDWAGQPLEAFAERLTSGAILGAFQGAALVGSTALDPDPDDPGIGLVTAVYVNAGYRGQGIAQDLLHAVEAQAKAACMAQLALTVALGNHPALRFYRAAGFRSAGQGPRALARDGQLLDLIRMVRPIRA